MSKFIEQLRLAEQRKHTFLANPQMAIINNQKNLVEFINIESTKILTGQFCNLAREAKWQTWLQQNVIDLHVELNQHLTISKSCKDNSNKMYKVLNELITRGEGNKLVEFLKIEFPSVIKT